MTATAKLTASAPAPGVPYYTPAQTPPAGTALLPDSSKADQQPEEIPALFQPLRLRSLTLQNRIAVSPMCTYSADNGHLTDFHLVEVGAWALRGAALTVIEATAVAPNGRISPEDSGLWTDSQIAPLKRLVDFIHSQGQKAGIQLAHAGRKASCKAPWHLRTRGQSEVADASVGGWPDDVVGPSAIPFHAETYPMPRELSVAEIREVVRGFADAARRAVEAGVDTIEIHGAHGYLISEFLSPISNRRTDGYGGSFENRTRLLVEVVQAVRGVIPQSMPLLVRVSATEWMEWAGQESWDLNQTIKLAKMLPDLGVDLLDVSSGGNNSEQKIDLSNPYYQINLAEQVREAVKAEGKELLVGAVGFVTTAEIAKDVAQNKADLVFVGRQFLREPEFVLRAAHKLGVKVAWPNQLSRARWPRDSML